MSLDQKSFEEDKVTVLCILNIHHSPGILKRKTISRKWKLTNSLPRILEKHYAFFLHFFFYLSSSHFPPSNVKNSAGSNLNCNVLKVLDSLTKWIGETRYCELSWLYQSKRKTVFQFLILLLKVVVFIWVAVRELVDLNFSLSQLLAVWNYEFLLLLGELLAFIILSFFFFTSAFVRQSAFASTGMRFTWD